MILGAIYNLSGRQAGLGVPSAQGARLAVDDINRDGGVLGRPIELVVEDGETDAAVIGKKTAAALSRHPNMSALIGLSDTDMVLAAATVAAEHERLFLTSGATSPLLPAEVPKYLFLACFGDNVQAAAAAEWAWNDLAARSVAVLYDATQSYTRLLQGYFRTRFAELGGVVLSVESYRPDDIAGPVRRLQGADVVFVAAWPADAIKTVQLLREAGFAMPVLSGDGFDVPGWDERPALSGVYFTTHAYLGADNPNPEVAAFRQAYLRAFPEGEPDAFTALGYDAAKLVAAAAERASSVEPAAVLAALADLPAFTGVTGTIGYSSGDRIPRKSVTILGIEDGGRVFVRELLPKSVPPPDSSAP